MSHARTNSQVAAGISVSTVSAATWRILDTLPSAVRRALHEAPVSINPASIQELLAWHGYGSQDAAQAVREAGLGEVEAFAAQHLMQHGYALPHQAAGATLQPYEARMSASRCRRCRT